MSYDQMVKDELRAWQKQMLRNPGLVNKLAKKLQVKINSYIPDKIHNGITTAIKQMVRGVLFGAKITTSEISPFTSFAENEYHIRNKISTYRKTASVEGGIAGAGGFLLAMAEFPVLLATKMKLLYEIASLYGYDVRNYKERLYILYIFQLSFSSDQKAREIYKQLEDWENYSASLPDDINEFNWLSFQQEYRDYIDLAKLAQLIPGIGAVIGVIVNYRLLHKLGTTAMNCYRMRLIRS